jgi:hypothetical protein
MQRRLVYNADDKAEDIGVLIKIGTIAALPLFPGILDKFLVESVFRQLPIALYGYEAFGCIHPARQGQSQIIENVSSVARFEMHCRQHAEIRFQRKLALEYLREKSCRNLVGEGIATAPGGFSWRFFL